MDKLEAFGHINQAAENLGRAETILSMIWEDGLVRLNQDDIDDLTENLKRINSGVAKVRELIKGRFARITNEAINA